MVKILKSLLYLFLLSFAAACSESAVEGDAPFLTFSSSVNMGYQGMEQTDTLQSSSDWTITGMPEWLTVSPAAGNSGTAIVSFTATENTTDEVRTARLLLKNSDGKAQYVVVRQGVKGELILDGKNHVLMGEAVKLVVNYESNYIPKVVVSESGKSWITVLSTKATSEKRLVLDIAENKDTLRQAEVLLMDTINATADTISIKQYPIPKVELLTPSLFISYNRTDTVFSFPCNIPLEASFEGGDAAWFHLESNELVDGKINLKITNQVNSSNRKELKKTTLVLKNEDCALSYEVEITQMFEAHDGDVVCLHEATYQPNPYIPNYPYEVPTMVFTADGFTQQDIESGLFDHYVQEAYQTMFATEPFKGLKDRFNAWVLYAESKDDGITTYEEHQQGQHRDTRFGVYFYDSSRGMALGGDDGFTSIINYAKKQVTDAGGEFYENTGIVIVAAKTDVYGGTTIMDRNGRAVALCPLATSEKSDGVFGRIVVHEAGGHGIGKLTDEYYMGGAITESEKRTLKAWQDVNMYMNVSLESDPSKVSWSWLIGRDGYEKTGVFAGGHYCSNGVWRSSETSMMKDAVKEKNFNAYSRYLIFERIHNIYYPFPGINPAKDAFLDFDKSNPEK